LGELLVVVGGDGLRKRETLGEKDWKTDLVCVEVWIGGDDGTGAVIDSFSLFV